MKEIFRKHGSVSQYYMVQISGILITWFPRNWIFLGGCFICRTLYIQPRIFIILLVLSDYQMSICSCLHLFSASGFSIAAPKTWNSFSSSSSNVYQPKHFSSWSQDPRFPAGLPIRLAPSFLHFTFGFCSPLRVYKSYLLTYLFTYFADS